MSERDEVRARLRTRAASARATVRSIRAEGGWSAYASVYEEAAELDEAAIRLLEAPEPVREPDGWMGAASVAQLCDEMVRVADVWRYRCHFIEGANPGPVPVYIGTPPAAPDGTLREAAQALVGKLDAVDKPLTAMCQIGAIHGMPYSGPSYGVELAALRKALRAPKEGQ